ncbi:hypothetical protein C8N36_11698 [Pelagimonas varians]|nr:hypothetical protein C8N36_11698 [Pelagimonas varians]
MDHLEPAIFPLTAQSDLVKDKGRGQIGQKPAYILGPSWDRSVGQTPRQGQVKPELFHHVRVPPLNKQCVLTCTQSCCAATRHLLLLDWCAETVKITNASLRNLLYGLCSALRRQRQKPTHRRQLQTIADRGGKRCRHLRGGLLQFRNCARLDQAKRRLQRSVKPVFTRCHRDVTQTAQTWLTRLTALHNIPAQPRCSKIGQGPIRRHIVNCKSRV